MQSTLINFPIGDKELTLRVRNDAFQPVTVTQKIAEQVTIPSGASVLDLGCGVGPIAIWAALSGAGKVTAVDVMPQAVEYAQENVERAGLADQIDVHCSDLFSAIPDRTFDVIVNDVSGIAERVARISPWYPDTIPSGGVDGTDVVLRMFDEVKAHLNPGGTLFFAFSSLSDLPKLLSKSKEVFGEENVELMNTVRIPFAAELNEAAEELCELREQGIINFETRRSRHIWSLEIYRATNADPSVNGSA